MYLKELEIFGFKSFPQKTLLTFEPGITVVVGPNGCGKSNVFDAIKWALGEQSPKSLRGSKMEDVIFNGTETHPPLNYAEVILTFCNEDKYLPIEYKEVAVGRRLYRSGESQYFINKNPVRLKDVQELFMGTGIGEATYSFIEQGKIEIFLSYKPEDKRLIFDEASGIVKYKERRRETYKKLQEADENLLRLEDILSEVRRQIRYLERQVAKAKQFKELQAQLIGVEKQIASFRMAQLAEIIKTLKGELGDFQKQKQQKDNLLEEMIIRLKQNEENLKTVRLKLEETTTTAVSLQAQNESASNNIAVYTQRQQEIRERNVFLQQQSSDLQNRLCLQEERHKQEQERLTAIQGQVSERKAILENCRVQKESLQGQIDQAKKIIEEQKTAILDLEGKRVGAHNRFIEIQATLSTLINRKKRLLLDAARLDTLLNENKDKYRSVQQQCLQAQARVEALQDSKKHLVERSKQTESLAENIRQMLVDKEKEMLELTATFEFLKDLRLKYETFSTTKKITVIFDEQPKNINKLVASLQDVQFVREANTYRASIEAKVVSFQEEQLQQRIATVQTEINGLQAKTQQLQEQKQAIAVDLDQDTQNLEREKQQLQAYTAEKEAYEREVLRIEEEVQLLEDEKRITLEDIADAEGRQKELQEEIANYSESLERSNAMLTSAQGTIADSQERIKEIDIEATRNRSEIQSLYKEKDTLASSLAFFSDELNSIRANIELAAKERRDNEAQAISLDRQIEELKAKIIHNQQIIAESLQRKKVLQAEQTDRTVDISHVQDDIDRIKQNVQGLQDSMYSKKLEVQSLEYEQQKIRDYLKQVYGVSLEPQLPEAKDLPLADLEAQKEKFQKRLKLLGEVNLVAIEEFEELKQRNDFFETQKQDLITSKENLKKAIQKINRTSRELFMETFEKIQQEFKKNFKYLFNGGRASLVLLDPDNVLESGVEIEVQPPGKKLQNVSLLSGGEKSLTAISLIFAIFQVRPSPLCVLDEIDAPLDEANVDRFNTLLRQFSARSQFVIITHNKKTMANAEVLYGVTMQERGISKLVSVKFASETEEATAVS